MSEKIIRVDGTDFGLTQFIADNGFEGEELDTLQNLEVGEKANFGGGAFHEFTVERIS